MSIDSPEFTSDSVSLPHLSLVEKRLRAFLENTRDVVLLLDCQLCMHFLNSSLERMLGYTPAEYIQLATRFELFGPECLPHAIPINLALYPGLQCSQTREQRVRHKDGTDRWVEATITNLLDDPEIAAMLIIVRDITRQHRAEEERDRLLAQAQPEDLEKVHLRSLIVQAPALIHILRGPEHVFEFFHPLGKALVGGRDLTGMKVREAIPEYEGQGYFELLDHVYQTGESSFTREMPSFLAAADGSLIERFFDAIYQPWYDHDGKIAGVLNFAVDVTAQVRARRQIEALAEALQSNQARLEATNSELLCQRDELSEINSQLARANRARSQFLSTMSHELRTPLTSILGFSRILLQSVEHASWSRREQDALERILKSGNHLLALINDVLDLARIDSGRVEISLSRVEPGPLLTSILKEMRSLVKGRDIVLRAEIEPEMQSLETDAPKLRQILLNLVANAIKFTEHGEVTISATRTTSASSGDVCLALAVKDTGIGIAKEHLEHLFESFYQVDDGNSRRFSGTGLGLAIVYQMSKLLGGVVTVVSEPGAGSTFTITLPCKLNPGNLTPYHGQPFLTISRPRLLPAFDFSTSDELQPSRPDEFLPDQDGEGRTIVVVDDNADIVSLLTIQLEETSYRVIGIQDPRQVMNIVKQIQPDAITLDVMMPELNGWQLLYQLKTTPETAHIPVLMLTILAEKAASYVVGADEYLIKPFDRTTLLAILHRMVEKGERLKREVGEAPQNVQST